MKSPDYKKIHNWLARHYYYLKIKCELCGSKKSLEFSLKKNMLMIKDIDNFWILCVKCHRNYDFTEDTRLKHKRKKLKPYAKTQT